MLTIIQSTIILYGNNIYLQFTNNIGNFKHSNDTSSTNTQRSNAHGLKKVKAVHLVKKQW